MPIVDVVMILCLTTVVEAVLGLIARRQPCRR
jgi:hypothetical protein